METPSWSISTCEPDGPERAILAASLAEALDEPSGRRPAPTSLFEGRDPDLHDHAGEAEAPDAVRDAAPRLDALDMND